MLWPVIDIPDYDSGTDYEGGAVMNNTSTVNHPETSSAAVFSRLNDLCKDLEPKDQENLLLWIKALLVDRDERVLEITQDL